MFEVHIFKHSLFHVGRHSLDHGRLPDVRCGVCGVLLCVYLWRVWCVGCVVVVNMWCCVWCWWCVVVWCGVWVLCGVGAGVVWCGGGVCVSFPFFLSILFFLFLALSLFLLSFLLLSFLLLSSLLSLLFLFSFSSLFSLLATKHCEEPINQHGGQLRGFWMWSGARQVHSSRFSPSSSPLPPPFFPFHPEKMEGTFHYRNISVDESIFYYGFRLNQKNAARENYSHYSFK